METGNQCKNIDTLTTDIAVNNQVSFISNPGVLMSSTSIHESVAGFLLSLKAESHLTPFRVFDNVGDKDGLLREA